ncbi:MAG TPA: EAL domain-containing protein [Rhodocyclaceae bacterium]|nr:EAL domain-containing protein [Rhodocyclaceae bacterium]HMZ83440.1 EAL domain-containing protein [Rhodocyclaceae bacterium]HNB77249.1 EAL domain-containing protein [Rhodocyclaceae bacterium]HNC61019.1 EAL domain-containing protein [Rhodocyclaceae bacterium]HNH11576.1 EAL domain-containing protein [Rhodocyclaceae bacterium]
MDRFFLDFSAVLHLPVRQAMQRLFTIYPDDEPQAPAFRAKQIQAVLRLTPLTMLANVVNALLVAKAFWPVASHAFLIFWVSAVFIAALAGGRSWFAMRRGALRQTASPRALRRAAIHASALAFLWAAVPIVLFDGADPHRQIVLACICAGMICAGGFALTTVPFAASLYVLILSIGSALAMFRVPDSVFATLAGLLCIYGFIVIASVIETAHAFGARLMAEARAERQAQVISLLLRDFEESMSDVLWEIDEHGRLRHASPRLAEMLDTSIDELANAYLFDHLKRNIPDLADEHAGNISELRDLLSSREPFRDFVIPLRVRNETKWWSLTAKPVTTPEKMPSGWRGVATDVTHARRAHEKIAHLAHHDNLTGLANRYQFLARLRTMLDSPAEQSHLAVACLDLDKFKDVNDALGHHAGDQLLQIVAQRLLTATRQTDLVARLGGDEFGLLLADADGPAEVARFARRLLDDLEQPCELDGAKMTIGASLGIAMLSDRETAPSSLLRDADFALYAAKAEGRGRFRFFEPGMASTMQRRQLIERELRNAMERGDLTLWYQPQVSIETGEITRFEALIRWNHHVHGWIEPGEFIPIAESSGLIVRLGRWLLDRACAEAATWPAHLGIAVNISPVQIVGQDLCSQIGEMLRTHGLASDRLELEITETAFLNESAATLDQLQALHATGVKLALDDFGTGYASLAYLRRLPFDTLKVDRSFVHEMLESQEAEAIVRSVVTLASTLGISTVAEGVESREQLDALRRDGCTHAQGFYLGAPVPAGSLRQYFGSAEAARHLAAG